MSTTDLSKTAIDVPDEDTERQGAEPAATPDEAPAAAESSEETPGDEQDKAGEQADGKREQVDPPPLPRKLLDAIERRRNARRHPVIPKVLATRDATRALASDIAGHVWFLLRFHGLRLPAYAAQVVGGRPSGCTASPARSWRRSTRPRPSPYGLPPSARKTSAST